MTSHPKSRASAGDVSAATDRKPPRIVVMSYNIRHGEGLDGRLDLARIASVINSVSPSIVALQEVDKTTSRSNGIDQAQALARLTGMEAVFGASMDYDGGKYGNAVLTSLPIRETRTIPLPGEPRSALCVTVRMPAGTDDKAAFTFIATHLDLSAKQRLASLPLIEGFLAANADSAAVLAGDMNAVATDPTMQGLHRTWVNATAREGMLTLPADRPIKQIDYILYRPAARWRVVESRVLDEPVASDHRPILAVLEWVPRP